MVRLRQYFSRFIRLQWKLAISYAVVTTIIVSLVFLVLLVFAYTIANVNLFSSFANSLLPPMASEIAPFFAEDSIDENGLEMWLDEVYTGDRLSMKSGEFIMNIDEVEYVAITDSDGELITAKPFDTLPTSFLDSLDSERADILAAALDRDLNGIGSSFTDSESGDVFLVAPILANDGSTLGALIVALHIPATNADIFAASLVALVPVLLVVLMLASVAGTIFGFFAARGYARRINNLTTAADSWSQGDFSRLVSDDSGDEIGLLSRRLNRMVQELQTLLATRQELATLEERNRLARDLHDSVKQQVFATAMQTGAARALIEANPSQAKTHLQEAEQLAHQAQRELTELIQELRPAALDGMGLAKALKHHADSWTRQQNIRTQVRVQGDRPLPLHIEQALYRVTQESLMNAAKHSEATLLDIHVAMTRDDVTLTIKDDGKGFDVAKVSGTGLGLYSMHERLTGLGGRLQIDSHEGGGTKIVAHCPLVRHELEKR